MSSVAMCFYLKALATVGQCSNNNNNLLHLYSAFLMCSIHLDVVANICVISITV